MMEEGFFVMSRMCAASFVSNTQYPNFRPIATPNFNYFQKVIICGQDFIFVLRSRF